MNKNFTVYLAFLFFLYSCGESKRVSKPPFLSQNKIDTNIIAIISADSVGIYMETDTTWFTGSTHPAHLTVAEINELEEILSICIDSNYKFNNKMESDRWLSMFKRQYVPFINENGEKLVWINCFKAFALNNWRSEIIAPHIIMDGGEWIFNVTVNLTTKRFNRLQKIKNGNG